MARPIDAGHTLQAVIESGRWQGSTRVREPNRQQPDFTTFA
jgi:hypothetical protein